VPIAPRQPDDDRAPAPAPPSELTQVLRVAAAAPRETPAALQPRLCEYVRVLKASGAHPEGALIAVKSAAHSAGIGPSTDPEMRTLFESIVRWCINEYYRAD
jgi:hypothetical protein